MMKLCDDRTMAVVGILGNHYSGAYDPIWDIDEELTKLNAKQGYQIGIHVDAASGGFVAPFQDDMPAFDFRLPNVLSISASGHKFGESICGTGWVVFRQREDLTEHIAISVSYLGGHCDSITLNFSRPASGSYVQMYKFVSYSNVVCIEYRYIVHA
jgi:glutamate decarboxylase